ncbi:YbgC/FadM family acyl-CoA thioesterase [Ahrensia sp. 13_GOM-1096m]|uniref:YbgC/FadM family acyl-CoA thioesterase n=1 Tax=Ahrensia sp. 13_GOM-1096m TaxID=1380380 RepID=UPI000479A891|nr:YbgC/FadM family acyl-CoA thioesterase [Ahrensia sp. 13_GOM-1096m]
MTNSQNGERGDAVSLCGIIDEKTHRLIARVYFADTDFSGAVYHGRYLEFLERGRSDFLRCIGVHHSDLLNNDEGALFWVVRRMELDFKASASIDDILQIETQLTFVGGARCMMSQKILRGDDVLIEAEVTAALINNEGKPRRFPQNWKESFGALVVSDSD